MTPRAEKTQKIDKKFSKNLKEFVKINIKFRVFSDRLFVSSHGRRAGGLYTGGLMVKVGVKQWGGGATAPWGGGGGGIRGGGVTSVGVVNL